MRRRAAPVRHGGRIRAVGSRGPSRAIRGRGPARASCGAARPHPATASPRSPAPARPDVVDQSVTRHDLVRPQEQRGEHGALARGADRDLVSIPNHRDGAEDAEREHAVRSLVRPANVPPHDSAAHAARACGSSRRVGALSDHVALGRILVEHGRTEAASAGGRQDVRRTRTGLVAAVSIAMVATAGAAMSGTRGEAPSESERPAARLPLAQRAVDDARRALRRDGPVLPRAAGGSCRAPAARPRARSRRARRALRRRTSSA